MIPEDDSPCAATTREGKPRAAQSAFARRHGGKLLALLFWLALAGSYKLYAWRAGLSSFEVVDQSMFFMHAVLLRPLVYLGLFVVRPLVLFPASVIVILAGFVFGPVMGCAIALVGGNLSASVAYLVGRFFGRGGTYVGKQAGTARHYAERTRAKGFESVMMVQLAYLPFDLVNYLAGFLRVGWRPFALATLIGSLPGTVSFVLLGASFEMDFATGAHAFNPWALAASAALFAGGIAASRYYRRHGRDEEDADE